MGRIYDALKRAEQSRHIQAGNRSEPALVVDESVTVSREPAVALAEPPVAVNGKRARPETVVASASVPAPSVLAVVADPASPAVERLRAVQVAVQRALAAKGHRTLLVTSPGRGDGKSVTASNLALLLAREGDRRVLLVDADLRKPALPSLFAGPAAPGVAEVLAGRSVWRDAVVRAPWHGLNLLPAGRAGADCGPLLVGPGAGALLADLRAAYDIVVVDSPPVLAVAESAALAGLVDAVLLVARDGHTPAEALVEAAGMIEPGKVIGMVLNAVPETPLGDSRYYGY